MTALRQRMLEDREFAASLPGIGPSITVEVVLPPEIGGEECDGT
jgi:hypothetical protein